MLLWKRKKSDRNHCTQGQVKKARTKANDQQLELVTSDKNHNAQRTSKHQQQRKMTNIPGR